MCTILLSQHRTPGWLDNLITGDEKWVLYVNTTRKRQWLMPGQKPIPMPKPSLHPKKRMLCVWWGVHGVLYWELLPPNTTINADKYVRQLQSLAAQVQTTGLKRSKIYFQHDNARPHAAAKVSLKLNRLGWNLLSHPPYSPDLAPSDYHLFRSLSNDLRDKQFVNEDDLKEYLQEFFYSKSEGFYARGIHDLPRRWREVIDSNGEYIMD